MSWLKRWWWALVLVVAPLFVIGAGVVVAGQVGEDKDKVAVYAAVVATLGILVAGAKNAYDVLDKERERRKKEDESREVLTATAEFCNYDSGTKQVGVELYNGGKSTVPVKQVRLV